MLVWGREVTGDLAVAGAREWLCTNGLGGFASGTVAGVLTRRYHGLLLAALAPPVGRTLLAAKLDETMHYDGRAWPLFANRWQSGVVDPHGYRLIARFALAGTVPVWTFACADALLEKRIWMEPGANTTILEYRLRRASGPVMLDLAALVNHRDYHGTTRGGDWRMGVEPMTSGVRVTAWDGARPFTIVAPGAEVRAAHEWYRGFLLAREEERGLPADEDHLHAATLRATLTVDRPLAVVLSAEGTVPDVAAARQHRVRHRRDVMEAWERSGPVAARAPRWIRQLVLAADQFVVRRAVAGDPDGVTVVAGYPWFADWGRDTMISLPGLALATGRPELARRVLTTFAPFVDGGMLPNRFPDGGEAPEYNTVDAALWYVEAVRAYDSATKDDDTLRQLFPALESIIEGYRRGTRYGIGEDPADGLIRAGEPGVQLTWMDAKIGDWVVTPRTGKPVEINALWYNALVAMARIAARLGRPAQPWQQLAARVAAGFARFWNPERGCCFDVLDGPEGHDDAIRPNQIFAVALPASPLPRDRQRAIVDVCGRRLLTSCGLRTLAPDDPRYRGQYGGSAEERDAVYHQGTVWPWLLGPFALAHFRVHGDRNAALELLAPLGDALAGYAAGTLAEIFEGDPPFAPRGCIAQAWSVAETLRAWRELADGPAAALSVSNGS